jgi:hypothetical protein
VIVVGVRIHDEPNGLVGNEPDDFFDDGEGPLLVQRRLDDYHEVVELGGHTVVRRTTQQPHPIG